MTLHLLALVDHPDHVCSRYRLRAFAPALAGAGHSLALHPHPRSWRASLLAPLPPADGCILQRRLPSRLELRRLRRRYSFLIFDFDDALWLRDSYSPRGLHSGRRLRRFRATVDAADLIVAGNSFLAEQATRFAPAHRVRIIPTCVEPRQYPCAPHGARSAGVRLVWIGSSSTLRGLEQITPTLERIGQCIPGVTLKIICDRFLELKHLPLVRCPWNEADEARELAGADIGIAWVPDDDWSRGKCGLKVLQYMAAGLPVIANPVGVHREMVRHGETGLLAESAEDWIEAVRKLARDPEMSAHFGRAGRLHAEQYYSITRGAKLWVQAMDDLGRTRHAA